MPKTGRKLREPDFPEKKQRVRERAAVCLVSSLRWVKAQVGERQVLKEIEERDQFCTTGSRSGLCTDRKLVETGEIMVPWNGEQISRVVGMIANEKAGERRGNLFFLRVERCAAAIELWHDKTFGQRVERLHAECRQAGKPPQISPLVDLLARAIRFHPVDAATFAQRMVGPVSERCQLVGDGLGAGVNSLVGVADSPEGFAARIERDDLSVVGHAVQFEARHRSGPEGLGHERLIEFMPVGVNKASGLSLLARHLGLEARKSVVFGDAENDIPMFAWASSSYAMPHAWPAAKRRASRVVAEGPRETAVARAVDDLLGRA